MNAAGLIESCRARPADFVIGGHTDPYLLRWYLTPRDHLAGSTYVHCIRRDDDDRALHDHPWDFQSLILSGSYRDVGDGGFRDYRPGELVRHRAEDAHRLVVLSGPVWTLVFTGPRRREWGFHCENGWVPWQKFVDDKDHGKVGAGCGP